MVIRVIDIETTGIDPEVDRIIEIASVDARRDGKPTNPMSSMVNPGMLIPPLSSAVHHIVDADVRHADPIDKVIGVFKGADIYVAHNAAFEKSFLTRYLGNVKWLCTYKCALRLWPDFESHSNQALRYLLGYPRPFDLPLSELDPHRALPDCYVTAAVLIEVLQEANEQETTFAELMEWSEQPALKTRMTFGKHKGKRFDEATRDYLEWLLRSDMDEDTKFSARHWLSEREREVA